MSEKDMRRMVAAFRAALRREVFLVVPEADRKPRIDPRDQWL